MVHHGRVVIMTTNHADDLDPALLRHGRIDLQLYIGHMTDETFWAYLHRFFPEYQGEEWPVRDGVAPSEVQNDIVMDLTPDELREKYCIKP